MFGKGFKYGMLLQLAVGPVSLLVFKTAGAAGFGMGLVVVLAVALVDAAYIAIAGAGAVYFLKSEKIQYAFKIISCAVLAIFGIITILGAFDINPLPGVDLFSGVKTGNIFLQGLVISASNPLTILFWNSIITSQTSRQKMNSRHIFLFGTGCVFSTLVFLTVLAAAGSMINRFLPAVVMSILNVMIGIVLIGYGIVIMMRKRPEQPADCPELSAKEAQAVNTAARI